MTCDPSAERDAARNDDISQLGSTAPTATLLRADEVIE